MECPNCGFEQPDADECAACGIIFAKWEEEGQRPLRRERVEQPQAPGPRPQNPGAFLPGGVSGWYGGEPSAPWGAAETAPTAARPNPAPSARPSAPTGSPQEPAGSGWPSAAPAQGPTGWANADAAAESSLPPGADAPLAVPVLGSSAPRPPRPEHVARKPKPEPASPTLKAIRLGAALGSLVIGVVLFLNGRALSSPLIFGLATLALGFFVWGVTTARAAVGRRQVLAEVGGVALLATVVAVFSSTLLSAPKGTRATRATAPAAVPATKRVLPDTPLGHLAKAAGGYLDALDSLLSLRQEGSFGFWQRTEEALSLTQLRAIHDALSDDDRARAFELWQRLRPLGDGVNDALKSFKRPSPDGFSFQAPDATRGKLREQAETARAALADLRGAIEIFE